MSLDNMKTLSEKVMWELENRPQAQDDDRYLIYVIYRDFYDVRQDTFCEVMKRDDLPSFESIRRARQKIQAECEWLRGTKYKQKIRMAEQESFIDYSRMSIVDILEA